MRRVSILEPDYNIAAKTLRREHYDQIKSTRTTIKSKAPGSKQKYESTMMMIIHD